MKHTKKCSECLQDKPVVEFYRFLKSKDGFGYICKPCRTEKAHAYYAKTKGAEIAKKREEKKANPPTTKICKECNILKPISEFYFSIKTQRLGTNCKECEKKLQKEYYNKNKNKILPRIKKYHKIYYSKNREKILSKLRKKSGGKARGTFVPYVFKQMPESKPPIAPVFVDNQQLMFDNCRSGSKSHRRKTLAPWATGFLCQKCLNIQIQAIEQKQITKAKKNLRKRLKKIVKVISKDEKMPICRRSDMLGCMTNEFKEHIQKQWKPGMNWKNYGSEWHIDHIRPCASFDLKKVKEQMKMNHYTNLQPLWASENISKGDYYAN